VRAVAEIAMRAIPAGAAVAAMMEAAGSDRDMREDIEDAIWVARATKRFVS